MDAISHLDLAVSFMIVPITAGGIMLYLHFFLSIVTTDSHDLPGCSVTADYVNDFSRFIIIVIIVFICLIIIVMILIII